MNTYARIALALAVFSMAGCSANIHTASSVASAVSDPTPTPAPSQPAPNPSPNPVPANAVKLANLQASTGWNTWGQYAPAYADCTAPCPGIIWSMTQGVSSPSLSGNATQFTLGGTIPYSDVLFSIPLIGQFSTQGLPDKDHSLVPSIHNFIYDADFYVTDLSVTQVLEFDVSMYMNGVSMIWGNQCNHLGGGTWDIWDNVNSHWVSTGVACKLIDKGWNHVTIEMQRKSDNTLLFQSFTLNGVTTTLNAAYAPSTVPASWWGITVNYQMDGDYKQSPNTTYLDNLTLTYW